MTSPYRRIEAEPHHVETERRYVERRSPGPIALLLTVLATVAIVAIVWIAMSGSGDTTDGDGGVPSVPTTLAPGGESQAP